MSDIETKLREAMDGVTPGKWRPWNAPTGGWVIRTTYEDEKGRRNTAFPFVCNAGAQNNEANAAYIALCSPDNIGALLDERAADRATIASLRSKLEEAEGALEFYQNGFRFHPKRSPLGVDLSEWKPTEALLEDCGETARRTLASLREADHA